MRFLFMLLCGGVSAVLTIIVVFAVDVVSFMLVGRPFWTLVFGNNGLHLLAAIGVGIILGFIVSNRILDKWEQARINRELEQDRIKYQNENTGPHAN